MGVRVVLAVVASLIVVGWAPTGLAQAAAVTDVTMYSDTGDYIGQGSQQVFTPASSTIAVSGNPGDVTIDVNSPSGYTLEFAAPQGQVLQTGIYDGAARAAFRSGSEPGIDISGDGRGCNTDQGRFEIKDIHFAASGVPDRLWLVYEQHCEGAVPALFGEVRLNEAPDSGSGTAIPGLVRWPVNGPGVPETVVPIQFAASAATQLSNATLGGSDPGDFTIREDDCGGQVLAPGGVCDVYVRFVPTAPGLRTAVLDLADSGGTVHSIPLQGWTYGGTTRLVMSSDPGEWIGQGQQYNLTPPSDTFAAAGDRNGFTFSVDSGNWTGSFHPGQGNIFTPNTTYSGAARDAFRGSAPGMEVDGPGRGCNTVTGDFAVTSATFAPDGTMQTFAIRFDQYCDGSTAGLHGEFDWRAGDTTPRAPWMGPGGSCSPAACSAPTSTGSALPAASTTSLSGQSSSSGSTLQTQLRILKASLAANSRRLEAALAKLRRHPRDARARAQAVAALGQLARELTALKKLFLQANPVAARSAAGRRVLGALTTLSQIMRAERTALAGHGARGLAAALRVAQRNASRERKALAVLARA